jgi:hypothetical protein
VKRLAALVAVVVVGLVPAAAVAADSGDAVTQPTRVLGTAYQPDEVGPTLVVENVQLNNASAMSCAIGATSSPTEVVAAVQEGQSTAGDGAQAPSFVVPAGWYYKCSQTAGTTSLLHTTEYHLAGLDGLAAASGGGAAADDGEVAQEVHDAQYALWFLVGAVVALPGLLFLNRQVIA